MLKKESPLAAISSISPIVSFQQHPEYLTFPQMNRSRIEDLIQQLFEDKSLKELPMQMIQKKWQGEIGRSFATRKVTIIAFTEMPFTSRKMFDDWRIQFGEKDASFRPYVTFEIQTRFVVIAQASDNQFKSISLNFGKTEAELCTLEPEDNELKWISQERRISQVSKPRRPARVSWNEIIDLLEKYQLIIMRMTDHEYRDDPRNITWIHDFDSQGQEYGVDGFESSKTEIKEHLLYLYYQHVPR